MKHLIPGDDGWPHAATTECGCQPQLTSLDGHPRVLVHVDMDECATWDDVWDELARMTRQVA